MINLIKFYHHFKAPNDNLDTRISHSFFRHFLLSVHPTNKHPLQKKYRKSPTLRDFRPCCVQICARGITPVERLADPASCGLLPHCPNRLRCFSQSSLRCFFSPSAADETGGCRQSEMPIAVGGFLGTSDDASFDRLVRGDEASL
ncbi:hypothetical protein CDAR_435921 [Caerostris darwini]|uniref:Uncharacterized protein n=1 Tax=Caerostris darwini TaxID=1538125 RepID=A0AAV4SM21_9ARAC|nr:hypothetical protein CDAR_435921 [Caerostris darwini]